MAAVLHHWGLQPFGWVSQQVSCRSRTEGSSISGQPADLAGAAGRCLQRWLMASSPERGRAVLATLWGPWLKPAFLSRPRLPLGETDNPSGCTSGCLQRSLAQQGRKRKSCLIRSDQCFTTSCITALCTDLSRGFGGRWQRLPCWNAVEWRFQKENVASMPTSSLQSEK